MLDNVFPVIRGEKWMDEWNRSTGLKKTLSITIVLEIKWKGT